MRRAGETVTVGKKNKRIIELGKSSLNGELKINPTRPNYPHVPLGTRFAEQTRP
jgi:hypothetical protein